MHQNEEPWAMAVAADESDLFVDSDIAADASVSAASHTVDGGHTELILRLVVVEIESAIVNGHMRCAVDNAGACVYPYCVHHIHGILEYRGTLFGWKRKVG